MAVGACILEDLCIATDGSFEEHMQHVRQVLPIRPDDPFHRPMSRVQIAMYVRAILAQGDMVEYASGTFAAASSLVSTISNWQSVQSIRAGSGPQVRR